MKDLDQSEELFIELNRSIVNLYKLCMEEMGYDLGPTYNNVEYHNYLANDPIYFYRNDESSYEDLDAILSQVDFSNYKGELISVDQLMKILPNANRNYAAAAISALDKYGEKVGLTTVGKLMVLAQFAHESGQFRFTYEQGFGKGRPYGRPAGPYGKVYYGRGPIQITWEANYKAITNNCFPKIGIDANIHRDPDLCCTNLEIGCAASLCWFMLPGNGKRAIAAANAGDVKALSKAINGGYTGLKERMEFTKKIFDAVK